TRARARDGDADARRGTCLAGRAPAGVVVKSRAGESSMGTQQTMTRRSLLGAGAALGAGLVLPRWTWAGTQSVAGLGGTTPPWQVWEGAADSVIGAAIARGEVAAVNELLHGWTKNGQALPAGLPADLRDFIEQARALPSWADTAKLEAAVEFNKKRGTYLAV